MYLQRGFYFFRHFFSVMFNGVLKFAGSVKVRGF